MRIFFLLLSVVMPAAAKAQNVGIGTSSPGYKLDVLGNGGYRGPVLSKNGNRVAGGTLFISNNDGSSYYEGSFSPVTYGNHKQSRCSFQSDGTQWYMIGTDFYEWQDTH